METTDKARQQGAIIARRIEMLLNLASELRRNEGLCQIAMRNGDRHGATVLAEKHENARECEADAKRLFDSVWSGEAVKSENRTPAIMQALRNELERVAERIYPIALMQHGHLNQSAKV